MANLLTDPSFELDSPAWAWEPASRARRVSVPDAKDGAWVAELEIEVGFLPPIIRRGAVSQIVTGAPAGELVTPSLWHRRTTARDDDNLDVFVYREGQWSLLQSNIPTGAPGVWTLWVGPELVVPDDGELGLRLQTSTDEDPANIGQWYFESDLWGLTTEEPMAVKRREILEGAAGVLRTITTANGHPYEVAQVRTEMRSHETIEAFPEIQLVYGDESKDENEMHRKKGVLMLHALLWCVDVTGATANEVADELAASAEQVLESQSGAAFVGLTYVDNVKVVGITPYEATDAENRQFQLYVLDVQVTYRYNRTEP